MFIAEPQRMSADEAAGSPRAIQRDAKTHAAETIGLEGHASSYNPVAAWLERRLIRDRIEAADLPYLVIDARPGLRIVDANDHYAAATMTKRRDIRGRRLFEVFPDNPQDPDADGVTNLYASLCQAAKTGKTHCMATQRYDVADADGRFVERHWSPTNTPIYDDKGRLLFVLHHARDVTAEVLKARSSRSFGQPSGL